MATVAAINVAFSQTGLEQFFPNPDIKDASFQGGQRKKAQDLGDDEKNWLPNFKGSPIHGLFKVTGNPADLVAWCGPKIVARRILAESSKGDRRSDET